jgi:hypothetical protein
LWRERWCADGDAALGVEHLLAQSRHPELVCEYGNLVYSCCQCNSYRQGEDIGVDLNEEGLGGHLEVSDDGTVHAKTVEGRALIAACRLNRPRLNEARRFMAQALQLLRQNPAGAVGMLLDYTLGYPQNLPRLALLRPPGGNDKPEGVAQSYYELRKRGELLATY